MAMAQIYASGPVFIRVREEPLELGTWRLLR